MKFARSVGLSFGLVVAAYPFWFAEPIRHENGKVAYWNGIKEQSHLGVDPRVYHSNGRVAFWNGMKEQSHLGVDPNVYHTDGKIAWDGKTCFHSNGTVLKDPCDGVTVSVGVGIRLSVRSDGNKGQLADLDIYGFQLTVRE